MSCRNCGFVLESQPQNTDSSDNLVSQILRGQRPLLDSDDALLNAEIVELERLQSLYAAQLEEIQSRQHAVLKALANRKSIYAPIRRLPRDILIEIFHSVCDSWEKEACTWGQKPRNSLNVSGPLWLLGRVCGLWRDTLHSSPASWALRLVVEQPFSKHALEILQTYLERTGEHLLDLKIVFGGMEEDEGILSLLVQSSHRWKNLDIATRMHHMCYLESNSHFSALQTIRMNIVGDYDCFRVCLRAPRLWKACLYAVRNHQIKLLPGITHFFGCITCPEDLHFLSQLPNLRRCRPVMNPAIKEAPVVTVAHLTHLYANIDALDVLSAPLLCSLVVRLWAQGKLHGPRSSSAQESLTRFLHRSKCHLESLSVSKDRFTLDTATRIFALEACSTISRLKLELDPEMSNFGIVEALTSPSVLPNLHHIILFMPLPSGDKWTTILRMARSRRDAGMLKLVELQFRREDKHDSCLADDMRALTQNDFEMRVVKRPPSCEDPLSPWHLS
ncbi:hypothetical protein IW262DRAFT_232430 [Armillaria fumosa]|nr:hypothetical protein IW262DRAFT_232430 [Armillaria fumosa]